MPLKPFDVPRLKIRRARYHIDDLIEQLRVFIKREPFFLEITPAPETWTKGKKWVVHVSEEVPLDFAAIIGDVIHNLRSALDLMACELVRANGQSDDDVHFPFANSATELDEMIEKRHMNRAKPEVIALLKSVAPYKGGNIALRAIHDLDIMDKHQELLPTLGMINAPEIPGQGTLRVGPIRDGTGIAALGIDSMLPIGHRRMGEFSLQFPMHHVSPVGLKEAPLGGLEIIPTLKRLANLVEGYVEACAAL
jgi:hypothetical protein